MHDLVRLFASEFAMELPEDAREGAYKRVLIGYLEDAEHHTPAFDTDADPADRQAALAWYEAERPNLLVVLALAKQVGRDEAALRLPWALAPFFNWLRNHRDKRTVMTTAQAAARALGDQKAEGWR